MALPNVYGMRADVWARTPVYMRLDALQQMENQLASQENRPALPVAEIPSDKREIGSDGQPTLRGYFDPAVGENGGIFIDPQLIQNDEPYQSAETYFHEARHAYQYQTAYYPEIYPEVSREQADQWRMNEEAYIGREDIELGEYQYGHYYGQPMEVDARQTGQERTEELYAGQFQDQAGYPQYRANADAASENREQKAIAQLGPDYQEQAWQGVQAKYQAIQDMQQTEGMKNLVQEPGTPQGNGQGEPIKSGLNTAETMTEAAAPEYGAAKEAVQVAETASAETSEAAGQSMEPPASQPSGSEGPAANVDGGEEESYGYGYGY
jgi:hypothetical protein